MSSLAGSDVAAWARSHEASFEVEPFVEVVKRRRVQVGFTLSLHARLPREEGSRGEKPRAAVAEIREVLREIVNSLAPPPGSRARVEIEAPRAGVVLEPEGRREPEVVLHAHVFHGDEYFAEPTIAEEQKVYGVARQLIEKGFKERHRRLP
jgi:hypothetical protein